MRLGLTQGALDARNGLVRYHPDFADQRCPRVERQATGLGMSLKTVRLRLAKLQYQDL